MWKGVLSANNVQRLDYLEIINNMNYSQQMDNRWDHFGQFFLSLSGLALLESRYELTIDFLLSVAVTSYPEYGGSWHIGHTRFHTLNIDPTYPHTFFNEIMTMFHPVSPKVWHDNNKKQTIHHYQWLWRLRLASN